MSRDVGHSRAGLTGIGAGEQGWGANARCPGGWGNWLKGVKGVYVM